tara:strand:- start:1019 stop:1156 length:138 start_codon:yes stop_codon:yes gene_type:complete
MKYLIKSKSDKENYTIDFKHKSEIRHWIINHLDLSKKWKIKQVGK